MKYLSLRAVLVLVLLLGLSLTTHAVAQTANGTGLNLKTTDQVSAARDAIENANQELSDIRQLEESIKFDDSRLVELQEELESLGERMAEINSDLEPRLEVIKAREAELGEAPREGEIAEPRTLREERQSLATERARINADIGEANAVSAASLKLAATVSTYRRTLFRQTLLGRANLSSDSLKKATQAFVVEIRELGNRISGWMGFTWAHKRGSLLSALSLSFLLAVFFIFTEYQLFSRFTKHDREEQNPSEFNKHTLAFWSTLLPTFGLAIFCTLVTFFLNSFNVLRVDIGEMLAPLLEYLVVLFFVARLASAILAPSHPNWRLLNVSDSGAHKLWWLIFAMAFVNAGDYLAGSISDVLDSPIILSVAKSFLATIIIGIILVITSFVRPRRADAGGSDAWPRAISLPLLILGLSLIILSLFGYVGLARFAATQIIVLGALLVTMYLGFLSAKAVSEPAAFTASPLGQYLSKRMHRGTVAVEQIGLLAGLLIYLFVFVVGVPIIFLVWGYHIRDIQNWAADSLTQITIGSVTISLSGILIGLLLFVVGYFVTRWFQRWLDENVMRRGRMEDGLRNSIRSVVGYLGIAIAGVIGASVAGLNLSNLALVAGALSLGIGFGLQNIVNNFVSGLILLAERPFKVGDWVVTGSTQGFVKHISVRATEIETFQRQTIIVPNSEFINTPVGNWTHRNRLGRTEIPIGVSYDADPRRVMELLEEIGASNDLVMREPAPFVVFGGFGDSSLDFELRVYISDVLSGLTVATDLRLKIFERFKQEGIEIPFPQRDVNLKLPSSDDETPAKGFTEQLEKKRDKAKPVRNTNGDPDE